MSKGAAGQEGLTPQGLAGWGLSPQADMGRPGFPKLAGFVYMSKVRWWHMSMSASERVPLLMLVLQPESRRSPRTAMATALSRQSRHRIGSHHALKALGLLHYLLQKE